MGIGAVQTNDVEFLVFHPEAAQEPALAGGFLRRYVEHQAPDIAQEFAPDIVELIVLAIEIAPVRVDHP